MWCGQLLNWDPVLGVATPQGSALGLLLLLIYVNDILSIEIHAAGVRVAISWLISMMNCLICCGSTQSVTVYYHVIYVECADAQKYLDLHIDYKHSWRNHVASICKKMLTMYLAIITWLDIWPKYFTYIRVLIIKVLVTYLVMTHLNIHFLHGVSLNLYLFSHIHTSSP